MHIVITGGAGFLGARLARRLLELGQLSLAGAPLLGAYSSYKGGHRLNSLVLQALFADASNWAWVQAPRTSKSRAPMAVNMRPAIAVAE